VGDITIPSTTIVVTPITPDNSTGNNLMMAFDFPTEGYPTTDGMYVELFIPT